MSFYQSNIHLSIHLPICLSINLYIYPSIYMSIHQSVNPSIYLSIHLSLYLPIHLSIYLFISYLSIHLSTSPQNEGLGNQFTVQEQRKEDIQCWKNVTQMKLKGNTNLDYYRPNMKGGIFARKK